MFRRFRVAVSALAMVLGGSATLTAQDAPAAADTAAVRFAVRAVPVEYKSAGDTVMAVLFLPEADGPRPGLVVIHEWWGLNHWVKESARRLAERGYVALAIDLYRGYVADDAEDAHELMRGLPEDRVAVDLQTAVEYLRSRKEVDRGRIGAIGWCMGGGYALQAARVVPDLRAAVTCYGRLVTEDESIAAIGCPVLGLFGGGDKGIPVEGVQAFAEKAQALGRTVEVHVYKDAAHAFMNVDNNRGHDAEATADAWRRIFAFLGRTLGPAQK